MKNFFLLSLFFITLFPNVTFSSCSDISSSGVVGQKAYDEMIASTEESVWKCWKELSDKNSD
ncbi:MAG: hypothetical protein WCJ84_00325 [Candidatus Peregrinibacteria bacterium]